MSLLTLVVLARLLVPADFGVIALATLFVSAINVFVDYGFSSALIQRRELRAAIAMLRRSAVAGRER